MLLEEEIYNFGENLETCICHMKSYENEFFDSNIRHAEPRWGGARMPFLKPWVEYHNYFMHEVLLSWARVCGCNHELVFSSPYLGYKKETMA